MGSVALGKTSRMDIRMTADQRRQIERAAQLSGESISQWSLSTLIAHAQEVIAGSQAVAMTVESFDTFARLLDEPQDPTFATFAAGSTRWSE